MAARVVSLRVQREKGAAARIVRRLYCDVRRGVLNDVHSGAGKRQVCLRFYGTEPDDRPEGLCVRKFTENVAIADMPVQSLAPDSVLRVGGCVLRLTQLGKTCYADCALAGHGKSCPLAREAAFAEVLESGWIALGDAAARIGGGDAV